MEYMSIKGVFPNNGPGDGNGAWTMSTILLWGIKWNWSTEAPSITGDMFAAMLEMMMLSGFCRDSRGLIIFAGFPRKNE